MVGLEPCIRVQIQQNQSEQSLGGMSWRQQQQEGLSTISLSSRVVLSPESNRLHPKKLSQFCSNLDEYCDMNMVSTNIGSEVDTCLQKRSQNTLNMNGQKAGYRPHDHLQHNAGKNTKVTLRQAIENLLHQVQQLELNEQTMQERFQQNFQSLRENLRLKIQRNAAMKQQISSVASELGECRAHLKGLIQQLKDTQPHPKEGYTTQPTLKHYRSQQLLQIHQQKSVGLLPDPEETKRGGKYKGSSVRKRIFLREN